MSSRGPDRDGRQDLPGARPVGDGGDGGGKKKRKGGLIGLALLLLLLAILAIVLLSSCGGDEPEPSSSESGGAATTAQPPNPPPSDDTPQTPTPGAEGGSFRATEAGVTFMPGESSIEDAVREDVSGAELRVQEVVEGKGFWVGSSASDRTFVELGSQAGETEQAEAPAVGAIVRVSGEVRPAPEDPEQTLGVDAEGAQQITEQGAFVNADDVQESN